MVELKVDEKSKKSKTTKRFPFGNFPAYYSRRRVSVSTNYSSEAEQTPVHNNDGGATSKTNPIDLRLKFIGETIKLLNKSLENTTCLDIGCNTGLVSLQVVSHLGARMIHGIDIDSVLVNQAIRNVPPQLVGKISFKTGDYTLSGYCSYMGSKFDAIFCLSVTKWIHLNGGDHGIKALFNCIQNDLRLGGIFILEPQQWHTYARRRGMSAGGNQNFSKINIKPDQFINLLESEYGFLHLKTISPNTSFSPGFQRPIHIFERIL